MREKGPNLNPESVIKEIWWTRKYTGWAESFYRMVCYACYAILCYGMVWKVWYHMRFLWYAMRFLCYAMVYVVRDKPSATVLIFNVPAGLQLIYAKNWARDFQVDTG